MVWIYAYTLTRFNYHVFTDHPWYRKLDGLTFKSLTLSSLNGVNWKNDNQQMKNTSLAYVCTIAYCFGGRGTEFCTNRLSILPDNGKYWIKFNCKYNKPTSFASILFFCWKTYTFWTTLELGGSIDNTLVKEKSGKVTKTAAKIPLQQSPLDCFQWRCFHCKRSTH